MEGIFNVSGEDSLQNPRAGRVLPNESKLWALRTARRPIRLSGYLDRRMEDVIDACAPAAGIDQLMGSAFAAALPADGPVVTVDVLAPTWVSGDNASIPLSWRVHEEGVLVSLGTASLSVLRVQSGHDPLTELLLTVDVAEPAAAVVAPVLRQVLDDVSSLLEQRRSR